MMCFPVRVIVHLVVRTFPQGVHVWQPIVPAYARARFQKLGVLLNEALKFSSLFDKDIYPRASPHEYRRLWSFFAVTHLCLSSDVLEDDGPGDGRARWDALEEGAYHAAHAVRQHFLQKPTRCLQTSTRFPAQGVATAQKPSSRKMKRLHMPDADSTAVPQCLTSIIAFCTLHYSLSTGLWSAF